MQRLIKAAEVWQPDADGRFLSLSSHYYGAFSDFESISKSIKFDFGEGLPGQTWLEGRPLVWSDLENDLFKRSAAARQADILCGLSIPIFVSDFLMAIVVLFFGHSEHDAGAVEVWSNQEGDSELNLADGYYGDLERFEWMSRRLSIMRGRGLPGQAWAQRSPVIMKDLGQSSSFLRARKALEAGITTGLAIPFFDRNDQTQILTFLSARGTPIARRFEIWDVDPSQNALVFTDGYCPDETDLIALHHNQRFEAGTPILGSVLRTGRPFISEQIESVAPDVASGHLVAIPVIIENRLNSVVTLLL